MNRMKREAFLSRPEGGLKEPQSPLAMAYHYSETLFFLQKMSRIGPRNTRKNTEFLGCVCVTTTLSEKYSQQCRQ